jgi:excisionase family DNA binding protein
MHARTLTLDPNRLIDTELDRLFTGAPVQMSCRDIATMLGISKDTIFHLVEDGTLPPPMRRGKKGKMYFATVMVREYARRLLERQFAAGKGAAHAS